MQLLRSQSVVTRTPLRSRGGSVEVAPRRAAASSRASRPHPRRSDAGHQPTAATWGDYDSGHAGRDAPPRKAGVPRRSVLLSVGGLPLASIGGTSTLPTEGTCSECVGLIDETLGSCATFTSGTCLSTFDDRPPFFIAPWEYPGTVAEAVSEIKAVVESLGGEIAKEEGGYVYATFADGGGVVQDDVEFFVSAGEASVVLRSAARVKTFTDGGRNRRRLDNIRRRLQWDEVPILRNRRRKFLLFESPWDDFGPTPPPGVDYNNVDDTLL